MLTVPNATTARAVRPRDVAAGGLLSVGFLVATAVVSGDGALGPTKAAPDVLQPTPGSDSTHSASPAAPDSTVDAAVITVIREPGQPTGSDGLGAVSSPVGAMPLSHVVPSAGTRDAGPLVPGGVTAPGVSGVDGPSGPGDPGVGVPGVRLPDVVGAGSGETTSSPSGTVDPGPLATVTEPLVEPLAPVETAAPVLTPVVQTAAPVVETLAEPVTEVAAQDDGAQPALTMLAPSLL